MKGEDGQNGDRAQAIDVGAISGMDRPWLRRSMDGVDGLLDGYPEPGRDLYD